MSKSDTRTPSTLHNSCASTAHLIRPQTASEKQTTAYSGLLPHGTLVLVGTLEGSPPHGSPPHGGQALRQADEGLGLEASAAGN